LHELLPAVKKAGVLINRNNQITTEETRSAQTAAQSVGVELITLNGGTEREIEAAFSTAGQQGMGAIILGADAVVTGRSEQIAELGLRYHLPTIATDRQSVKAGHLIGYGTNDVDIRQAGVYVGRILKGEKPANLPVVQPTKFELIIDLKTAKALGLTVPPGLLAIADEVIE
jgi:putative ABC transport system substrate-binding protein